MAKKAKKATNIRAYKTDTSLSSSSKPSKSPKPASKTPNPPPPREKEAPDPEKEAELKVQQTLLDIFQHTFADTLASDSLTSVLQEVKQALFNRDFGTAFGKELYLEAYAARWSPTRALCYATVLSGLVDHLDQICTSVEPATADEDASSDVEAASKQLKIVSIGGGAAEIVAFAAFLQKETSISGTIINIDSAPWGEVVKKLHGSLTTPPPISKYASEATRAANPPPLVLPSQLNSIFIKQDVLAASKEQVAEHFGTDPLLITLLFTLNELYTSGGIGKTTTFLLDLTMSIPGGSLLLVVDSPGSYSETTVGKESKKYPTQWLLDRTLLKSDADVLGGCKWEKLESNDSTWFRLAETLQYPIPLENMRYQMHLYRAVKP